MANQIENNEAVDFLKNARDIAFVVTIFLYYMGWIYIYFYLEIFGLSIKAADVSIYNLLIYSSNVFIYLYTEQKFIMLISIAIILFAKFYKPLTGLVNKVSLILIIALFPVVFLSAKSAADHNGNFILHKPTELKGITFTFKEIKMGETSVKDAFSSVLLNNNNERLKMLNHNENGSFRLLTENNEQYFVMLVADNSSTNCPNIYFIDKKNVEFALVID